MWLDGKTVIITGASGGLGFAMAKLLIEKHGCTVIGVARNREKAENAAAALGNGRNSFSYYLFDVTDREEWAAFARRLEEKKIVPDILINNAGIMPAFERAESCSDEEIDAIVKTNFVSYVTAIRALLPLLEGSPSPAVVNICSAGGLCPVAGESMYCATKYAVRGFTDTFRAEHRRFYVAGIYPGFIRTDIMRRQKVDVSQNSLIQGMMMPADKAAGRIVRAVGRRKKTRVIGVDGHLLSFFGRLAPVLTASAIERVLRLSGQEIFAFLGE